MNQCQSGKSESENEDFYLKQINTGCLSQFSYYLESNKEAVIIDPMREPDQYLDLLKEREAKLKYIFETHFHADFVSGHVELAKLTGAKIVYGPEADPSFDFHSAKDGEVLNFGKVSIKVLHTPGHTLESSCYLLLDSKNQQKALFTGDTMFLGEVGRPDLAVKDKITEKDLASMLYDSIHNKIKPLDGELTVYPGHGAGSACGKKISAGSSDLLKNQKMNNYAFDENLNKEEFIEMLTTNLTKPPQYFFSDVLLNKKGYDSSKDILDRSLKSLSLEEFEKVISNPEVVILDNRDVENVVKGYIPNSIAISLKATFATWVATLFPSSTKFVVVTETGKEKESIIRLARVGLEHVIGYLEGGFKAWQDAGKEVWTIDSFEGSDIIPDVIKNKDIIVDVREKGEWESSGVYPNSHLNALSKLEENLDKIPKEGDLYLLCRSGQRSVMAATILKKKGFKNKMINVYGGLLKLLEGGHQPEPYTNK